MVTFRMIIFFLCESLVGSSINFIKNQKATTFLRLSIDSVASVIVVGSEELS